MGGTYVYRHPQGAGLGQHHAGDRNLRHVLSQPPQARSVMHAALATAGPHRSEREGLQALLMRTMHDLDLPDGAVVEHAGEDTQGRPVIEWADQHGNPRRTSVDPAVFTSYFARA